MYMVTLYIRLYKRELHLVENYERNEKNYEMNYEETASLFHV